ncbi:MAG: cysteine synthase A [Lachnospiraceae bacterium]|nr:cysteine synthase A [Lachnospiraceae bacterium]
MMTIYKGFTELIGKTPLVEVTSIEQQYDLRAKVLVKLEYCNPAGSVKDRAAYYMIKEAEEKGILKEGSVIIEPTSGNTGIGLAAIAATKGYRAIFTMPETMSVERRNILKAYGAEIVLTEGAKGMKGAIEKAEELAKEIKGAFIPAQFENPANAQAHYETTGPEIWEDTDGTVDIFVASVGTGGTITGTGRFLKEKNAAIKVVAVEPSDSPVLSGGQPGAHKIQGIGAGFVPNVLDTSIYDEIVSVENEQAFEASKKLTKKEGILTGISSGAALFAAIILAKRPENAGKTIVALLPDSGDRYYSTPLFTDADN